MRKLKLQVQVTVDGFMAGPGGQMDWMKFPWTEDINKYVDEITAPVDTIVLGRVLAEGFIPHWASIAADPGHPEVVAARKYSDTRKVVFSNTLDQSPWQNAVIAKGNLVDEINSLKNQKGQDIIAYGGSQFVSSLLKEKLIDELHLFVNPAAIGNGLPVFKEVTGTQQFKLINSQQFKCGIVVLVYKVL